MPIIHTGEKLYMENGSGFRWEPYVKKGRIGLGRILIDGKPLGEPIEDFFYETVTERGFYCTDWEVAENNEESGVLRFLGKNGAANLIIEATMKKGFSSVSFDCAIEPELPINHRLYLKVPFSVAHTDFVKIPFENTMYPDTLKDIVVENDYATVPMIFGRQKYNREYCYLGAGHDLRDDFTLCKTGFNVRDEAFELYLPYKSMMRTVDMQLSWRNDALRELNYDEEIRKTTRRFRFDIFGGKSQYEALRSHMEVCGYDLAVDIRRGMDECTEDLMRMLKNSPGYDSGRGYHMMIRTDNGEFDNCIVRSGYGVLIPTSWDVKLAVEMYRYYCDHPEASWARERAFEMADFFMKSQMPNGAVTMYITDTGNVDHAAPMGIPEGYFVTIFELASGAVSMMDLYEDVKKHENIERADWLESGKKAAELIASLVADDGTIGRNYSFFGTYDSTCSGNAPALLALLKLYKITGNKRYDELREKLDAWTWNTMLQYNAWCDSSHDSGSWDGSSDAVRNNDSMLLTAYVHYCAEMHKLTGEQKYIDRAKDVLMYEWAISVPVQIGDFTHYTKMLVKEQDLYVNFDAPIKCQDSPCGYQYLSKVSGDPIFVQLMRIILQTEIDLQEREDAFKGIHLGLDCDTLRLRPIDKFGEGKIVIPQLAGIVMSSVSGDMGYRYVGGKGWGYGIDYQIPFDPLETYDKPYVSSCTSMLREQSYNPNSKSMRYWVYDKVRNEAEIEITWNGKYAPEKSEVYYNEEKRKVSELIKDGKIVLRLKGDGSPSKVVQIMLAEEIQ